MVPRMRATPDTTRPQRPDRRHTPAWKRDDRNRTRWECPACPWATPWTLYTDATAGAQAVRHALGLDLDAPEQLPM